MAFFNNTTAQNASQPAAAQLGWTPLLLASTTISCASFTCNAIMLLLQFLPQTLVTSFTIYLIAISIGNILWLVGVRPLAVYSSITGVWPGGHGVCATYTYFQFVISQIPVLIHVLISLNRLWAVSYPASYRQFHHKKMAVLLCLATVAYVHVVHFTMFLLEFFHYSPAVKPSGCQPGAGGILNWRRVDIIIHRIIPLFLVLGIYIYIIFKRWMKKHEQQAVNPASSQNATASTKAAGEAGGVERLAGIMQAGRRRSLIKRRQVKPFIILTATSITVFICWVPSDVYWALTYLNFRLPYWVFNITSTLYSLQMFFDPIMWLISLR
ncbi:prostaglandin E2 receptor EP4 subtype-like [Paramacrobiotus metropolitanus]|uniref:prostaglandin E2 receptor EP4 subtype-like n=1 Tax=Paramacrobiotus metropolitanus TaxID=2943436 RepID=UPI002445B8FD|nr:prostaglandin E2 receptor EP4 subtype-like [Paramacrobiotus metropolitanus]